MRILKKNAADRLKRLGRALLPGLFCAAALMTAALCGSVRAAVVPQAVLSAVSGEETKAEAPAAAPQTKQQDIPQPFAPSEKDRALNEKRLAEAEKLLAAWSALKPEETAARFGVEPSEAEGRTEVLTGLKNLYPRVVTAMTRRTQLEDELKKAQASLNEPLQELTDKPPYTLTFYDAYVNSLEDLRRQSQEADRERDALKAFSADSEDAVKDGEAAWRLARDTLVKEESAKNRWDLEKAALALESARAQRVFDLCRNDCAALTSQIRALQLQRRASLLEYVRRNLDLSEKGFKEQTALLAAQSEEIEKKMPGLRRQLKQAENDWEAAQEKLASARTDAARDLASLEEQWKRAARDYARGLIDSRQNLAVFLARRRRLWTLRYNLFHGKAEKTLIPAETRKMLAEAQDLDKELLSVQKALLSLQAQQATVDKALAQPELTRDAANVLKKHRAVLLQAVDSCLDYVSANMMTSAQERSFAGELKEQYRKVGFLEKAGAFWRDRAAAVLRTELWESGGYAVRLQEFLIALALMTLGSWAGRRLVRFLLWAVSKRVRLDETGRRTFERFLFYLVFIIICLISLKLVNIPLTAFAFLGGAFVIAIGFGTQNIFNNLISGILLAVNRPFRLGDTIEAAGYTGRVFDMGMRSTLVRTFDGKTVILPNSTLLDHQLVNWGRGSTQMRTTVTFGAEYGTPVKKVRDTVMPLLLRNPRIKKMPEPMVLFDNFGDSSLDFSAIFWFDSREVSGMVISSEVREAIQTAFDEAGLSMPFPRLDVSFPASAPSCDAPPESGGGQR